MMFQAPTLYGTEDFLVKVPNSILNCLEEECTFYGTTCNEDMMTLCQELMSENAYQFTENPHDAVQLYINLREKIYALIS